jgi:hypothetical protein
VGSGSFIAAGNQAEMDLDHFSSANIYDWGKIFEID